jgi:hypothetical protein
MATGKQVCAKVLCGGRLAFDVGRFMILAGIVTPVWIRAAGRLMVFGGTNVMASYS